MSRESIEAIRDRWCFLSPELYHVREFKPKLGTRDYEEGLRAMIAPLKTIRDFYFLRSEAVLRIDRETAGPNGHCALYISRGPREGYRIEIVRFSKEML